MNAKEAKRAATNEFFRSVREADGFCPREADDDLNDATRKVITAMVEQHGMVYLGNYERSKEDQEANKPILTPCEGGMVYNFGASFVVPTDDQILKDLIRKREDSPYTGTKDDYVHVEAIQERIGAIGGCDLVWS